MVWHKNEPLSNNSNYSKEKNCRNAAILLLTVFWVYFRTYSTDTCDVVAGQDFVIVAETEDKVSVFLSFAALRLTVAAVQLHLDLTLAMTLHG